jgi:hypothetical protein
MSSSTPNRGEGKLPSLELSHAILEEDVPDPHVVLLTANGVARDEKCGSSPNTTPPPASEDPVSEFRATSTDTIIDFLKPGTSWPPALHVPGSVALATVKLLELGTERIVKFPL